MDNKKIFIFNYMDEGLKKSTKEILEETGYYIYPSSFDNDLSDVDYIGFSKKENNISNLKEFGENLTKVSGSNSTSLNKILKSNKIDFALVKAFNYYFEYYIGNDDNSDYHTFINKNMNYIQVKNLKNYRVNRVQTYAKIDFTFN